MQRALLFLVVVAFVPRAAAAQGDPVGPEFRVNTYTTGNQFRTAVASDSSGKFVVVWTSYPQDGSSYGVFGQVFASSGAPLGPEFRINTFTTGFQYRPAVASDSFGNFVVVWESRLQGGSTDGIFGQRFASSGARLGPQFHVNTYTTDYQSFPAVASDTAGNFVVVWQSNDGSTDGIFGQRFASSGEPLGSEFLVNTYTTQTQRDPAVASDSSGNFVVVWESAFQKGNGTEVFGQRYATTGAPLGPEFRVNTFTTGSQDSPAVASDSSGNFVVVWMSLHQDGALDGVFAQRYTSTGAPLGPEFRVNTFTTGSQGRPAVASNSSGNFVVVWESFYQDGSGWGVFGRRYATSGVPLGRGFRVNTYTTSAQSRPSVASDSSGNLIVVWESFDQDSSDWDVFGQRFNKIAPGPSWREHTDPVEP